MPIEYQNPETSPDPHGRGTIETHPAYGQVRAARVTGRACLYGSDFEHHDYIVIEVSRSEVRRDLATDWPHPREELLALALSEAQWASFVSTLNHGTGTRCTLQHVLRKSVPQIPNPPDRRQQAKAEMAAGLAEAESHLAHARELLQASGLSKVKAAAIESELIKASNRLSSGTVFVSQQFEEHVESTLEHAKVEIEAHLSNVVQRTGLATMLGNAPLPLSLPAKAGSEEKE